MLLLTASSPWGAQAAVSADVDSLYESGLQSLRERQMYQAEQTFLRCIETDSTFYEAYIALARMYLSRNSLDQAEPLLLRAMRQDPGRVEAPFEYSRILAQRRQFAEADQYLKQVLSLDPGIAAVHLGVGFLRMKPDQLMDLEGARDAFAAARALEPENLEAVFYFGKVSAHLGDWNQAVSAFGEILKRKPNNFSILYQLAMIAYRQENFGLAAEYLQRAAETSRDNLIVRWALYLAFRSLGGYPADLDPALRFKMAAEETIETGVRLVDVAGEYGVARLDLGRGSAWADYDLDGDLDLFTMGHFSGLALYRNEGDRFSEQTAAAGFEGKSGMGCLFADYDNDGDPDLYITRDGWYGGRPNSLWRNEGNDQFTEVGAAAGVDDAGSSFTASWGDLDNDGHLDLFVANGVTGDGTPSRLYRGDRREGFADVAEQAGVRPARSIGSALGDYDNDGDLDLYVANFNQLNSFYRNDTDHQSSEILFTDVTRETRTQLPVGGYFTLFFDYDNDGDLDLFCSELSDYDTALYTRQHGRTRRDKHRPALYRNEGTGSFVDATYRSGLGKSYGTTGAQFGDVNGDGFPDIYLANGGEEMNRFEPDALLLNLKGQRFVDIALQIGMEQLGKGYGVSFADFDGDGDQDVYVPIGGTFPGDTWENRLYRNDSSRTAWLTLRLEGTQSNRDAIGARVRLTAGGAERHAAIDGGSGFASTNSLQLEIGLGQAEKVDELEIRWPSGQTDRWIDLDVDQMLKVREGHPPR